MISAAFPYQKQRRRVLGSEMAYVQPRQIPIEGQPAHVVAIATAYADWLATSSVPKLFLKAQPGGILAGGAVLDAARRFPAQTEVTVAGVHFVQEDSPDEIGRAIAGWMGSLTRAQRNTNDLTWDDSATKVPTASSNT